MTLTDVIENWTKNNELLKNYNLESEIYRYSAIESMDVLTIHSTYKIYTMYINDNYVEYHKLNNRIKLYVSDPQFFEKLESYITYIADDIVLQTVGD